MRDSKTMDLPTGGKMSEYIVDALARLDDAKSGKDVLIGYKKQLMESVMTPEIKQQIQDIEDEIAPDLERFDEVIQTLSEDIKDRCISNGASVKGEHMRVSFVKGRVSWDSKGLSGFAIAHPEILAFQKTGNPTARIGNV